MFIHLNVKSEYSLLNSIAKAKDIVDTVKNYEIPAVAVCDLNNMYNTYHFEQDCKKAGIKNIIGVSFCIKYNDTLFGNLTLLAKDVEGYKNLVKLSTLANKGEAHVGKKGFAYLDYPQLKKYTSGIFCLTGGTSGALFKLYTADSQNKYEDIAALIAKYIEDFGRENVYIEMQDHKIPEERLFITDENIRKILESLEVEPVATNDVYMMKKEHAYHRALALGMNPNPNGIEYYSNYVNYNDEWYLKTPEEMEALFQKYTAIFPNIISNTVKIAERCNASVPIEKALPEFPIPSGYDEESYLRYLAYEGFNERFEGRKDIDIEKYRERLEYEIDVIKKMGFIAYHIITADFIQWAKDDRVYEHPERYFPKEYYQDYSALPDKVYKKDYSILVGPGRGSAAGSLLCYCLKITNLDPIKDGLLFERFLNVERVSMPDIDIDFPNAHRYDVVEYVQAKYGYEKVSQIATFQTLGVKSIIKSVGKALGISFKDTNEMTKEVPDKEIIEKEDENGNLVTVENKIELLSQLENLDYFKSKIITMPEVKELFEIGKVLEGLPSATGKHAAGVIIARRNLMNYLPLMEVDGVMVTQFEKKAAESIGLLKMDFLGLQTLDVLAETMRLIKVNYGLNIDLDNITLDDEYVFQKIFQTGETGKVFQFEGAGMKTLLKRMKPTCMADLCAANAAFRPGPMQFIDDFIDGRNNPEKVKYPTKEYKSIAKETMGILFYQEQIMQIVQAMAGFTLGEADVLRRGIGKKEKKYIDEGRERFVTGCLAMNTADEKTAKYIYSTIEKFANYGFNKSHSDAYALVAYLCGYFKAYYPECFMSANLTICSHNEDKLAYALAETKKMGITILPPDIRLSSSSFKLEKINGRYAIRYSLSAIKTIREDNALLFEKAKNKDSLFGFLKSIPVSNLRKNQIANLIYAGAFDYLGTRKDLYDSLDSLIELARTIESFHQYTLPTILSLISPEIPATGFEYQLLDKLRKEKSCIRISLSGHPVEAVRNVVSSSMTIADMQNGLKEGEITDKDTFELAVIIDDLFERTTKKGQKMASCIIEDEFSTMKAVIFPKDYEKMKDYLAELIEMPVLVQGRIKKEINEDNTVIGSFIISGVERVVKSAYSIYFDLSTMDEKIKKEMTTHNGIASAYGVDKKEMKITKMPFALDINPKLLHYLEQHKVSYIIKK